ncbi:MAG: hypothetical protein Kow00128_09450 [Deltaproteobacteria bacterium]
MVDAQPGSKGLLDGRSFLVERGRRGKPPFGKDLYRFEDGIFRSVSCDRFGCQGPYSARREGDSILFTAVFESESLGTMHWEGKVSGDSIEVRYSGTEPARWYERAPKTVPFWGRSVPPKPPGSGKALNPLEGVAFVIDTGGTGKDADHNDILLFSGGTFVSTRCEDGGFRGKSYTTTREGGSIRFRGEVESPEKGRMVWEGTVRGDAVEGTMRWTYRKWFWTFDREYWYRGRRAE